MIIYEKVPEERLLTGGSQSEASLDNNLEGIKKFAYSRVCWVQN